jgi:site-specific DNA-methyltransferase (adenine-specific)
LLYRIILSSTKPGDIVLDPFFGTGTTGVVAKRLGRNYVGLEREKKYIEIAEKRIEQIESEPSLFSGLSLEVKPPRVRIQKLIETGLLSAGEKLFDKKGNFIGTLTAEGHVDDGSDILSIHKMAAKHLCKHNHNGWDYFYVERDEKWKPMDELRYEYTT